MNGFLTVTQAANLIGVHRQTVHDMIASKRINAVWMLERWAVPKSEVVRIKGERAKKRKRATKTAKS